MVTHVLASEHRVAHQTLQDEVGLRSAMLRVQVSRQQPYTQLGERESPAMFMRLGGVLARDQVGTQAVTCECGV